MKTSLLKGLNADDKDEIKGLFISALRLRLQIIKTLQEKYDVADAESLTKDAYESSSWAFKQADLIGYKRGITEVISLLTDDKK